MQKIFDKTKVLIISLAHFNHDIISSFLALLLPLIIEKLGLSLYQVALLNIIKRIPALFNPLLVYLTQNGASLWYVGAESSILQFSRGSNWSIF